MDALAMFVAEVALKGLSVLAATACVAFAVRRRSAAVRTRVWAFGLAAAVLVPLTALGSPVIAIEAAGGDAVVSPQKMPGAPAVSTVPPTDAMAAVDSERFAEPDDTRWGGWVLACWLAGALVTAAVFVAGEARIRGVLRRARPIRDPSWLDLLSEAAADAGIARPVALACSDEIATPLVAGVFRPAVLVPAGAHSWSPSRRRAVLLHELAHVRRGDPQWALLGQVGCALHWFDPLAWFCARRLREQREPAADDIVLASGLRPSDYATHLVELAMEASATVGRRLATASMAGSARFEDRVTALLDDRRDHRPGSRRGVVYAAVLAAVASGPVACIGISETESVGPDGNTAAVDGDRGSAAVDADGDGSTAQGPVSARRLAEIEALIESTGSDEERAVLHLRLGQAHVRNGHPDEAAAVYRRVLAELPTSIHAVDAHVALGDIEFEAAAFDRALAHYEQALALPETAVTPYARYKKGWIHINRSEPVEALEAFFIVATQTRGDPEKTIIFSAAKKDFVRVFADVGRADKAYAAFRRVDVDGAIEMAEDLGRRYLDVAANRKAALVYDSLATRHPDHARRCVWQAARVEAATGDRAAQGAALARLVEIEAEISAGGDSDAARDCRGRLEATSFHLGIRIDLSGSRPIDSPARAGN